MWLMWDKCGHNLKERRKGEENAKSKKDSKDCVIHKQVIQVTTDCPTMTV